MAPPAPEEDELQARFREFAHACSAFSREVLDASPEGVVPHANHIRLNLQIARTVFSKWSVEIASLLYTEKRMGFQDLKNALGRISARVLSTKLKRLEKLGLVRREVLDTRPPRTSYSLTEKGLTASKLGEPMYLFLRYAEDLLFPDGAPLAPDREGRAPKTGEDGDPDDGSGQEPS